MFDREVTTLRPAEEVVAAHNFLAMLVVDEKIRKEILNSEEAYREVRIALSVLCWALQHDNDEFVFNLDRLSKLVQTALAEEIEKQGVNGAGPEE